MASNDGAFYCHACLTDKALVERSFDDRYCRSCYDFLLKEAEILAERGITRRGSWMPATPETLPGHTSEERFDEAVARQNSCNKIQTGGNHHAGRPHADIPLEKVMAMVAEGLSLRAIAHRLGTSHMTIKRALAKEKILDSRVK
jgi:hypothetical protein